MAYQSRTRKRVHANPIRRAPNGSAFQQCECCGISVAIALVDMHECGFSQNTRKKPKTQWEDESVKRHQPRSPFHFFMEEFSKTCIEGDLIEKDRKGCEMWKNLSKEDRQPYVDQAFEVDSACLRILRKEENEIQWVDEEAHSAEVGKYDKRYEDSKMNYYDSESCLFLSETYDTFYPKAS